MGSTAYQTPATPKSDTPNALCLRTPPQRIKWRYTLLLLLFLSLLCHHDLSNHTHLDSYLGAEPLALSLTVCRSD